MKPMSYLFAIIVMLIAVLGLVEALLSGKLYGLLMCGVLLLVGWGFIHNVKEEEYE